MNQKIDQVLDLLQQKTEPVSLSFLQKTLQLTVQERTLRRWLTHLVKEGLVITHGKNRGRKYSATIPSPPISHGLRAQEPAPTYGLFSTNNAAVIQQVKAPLYTREPCTYNEDWLLQYEPNVTSYLTLEEKQHLADNGNPSIANLPAGTYTQTLFHRLLIDLSYNSSRLEGNTYSRLETEKLLIEGKVAAHKLDTEKLMIMNHKAAITFLVEASQRISLNEESIRTLHYLLSDGLLLPEHSGNLREEPVRVSGTTYIPLESHKKLTYLFNVILEKAYAIHDNYEQSFFLLVHLSYLQAFLDVNKRTARLASNIPLVKSNNIPIAFQDIPQEDYISAIIAIYEQNHIGPLKELYIYSYLRTCKAYSTTLQSMDIDVKRVQYRTERRQLIATIIEQGLIEKKLHHFIQQYSQSHIPLEDNHKFIADVMADIKHLDTIKIAGMGITKAAFLAWQRRYKK